MSETPTTIPEQQHHDWKDSYTVKNLDHDDGTVESLTNVVSKGDMQFLQELGNSRSGQIVRYEMAEMYGISPEELKQILANTGGDL